jgi:predicted nucleotidyltransferase
MLTRERILEILAESRPELERRKVRSAALFGSFARDEAGPDSDVDVVVALDRARRPTLFDLGGVQHFLGERFGRPVSLVIADNPRRRPRFAATLARESIRAF